MGADERAMAASGGAVAATEKAMDAGEAAEHLATIRRIMESATRLTVLPGKAAVFGGVLALAGCGATYGLMQSLDFGVMAQLPAARQGAIVALWAAVAALAIGVDVLVTVRLARRSGKSAWSRMAQLAAYAMGPGVLIGVALTVALAMRQDWRLLPAVWMMLYGGAVWMTGILSVRAPGILGAGFFVAGVVALFWAAPVALALVALTFGLGHVAYGAYLLKRFGD